jgi:hypothetical protein
MLYALNHAQVKCTSCHEVHPKLITINQTVHMIHYHSNAHIPLLSLQEEHTVSGGKDSKANFVWKCGNCKRESSASIVGDFQAYAAENGQPAPLLTVECRGLEFVGFDPKARNVHLFHSRD